MQTLPIPLANGAYKNIHDEELNDRDSLLVDCYVDEAGYTRGRPGLSLFKDMISDVGIASYAINGIFWWSEKSIAIVISYGKVFKLSYPSNYPTLVDLSSSLLSSNATPTFASDGTYAFAANGGRIVYTDGTTATAYIADSNAPTTVTHVAWLDGYLLCNNGTNKFYWADVNNSLTWNALNFASAAGDADVINALHVFQRDIYLFGGKSLEIWQNDGVNPFSRDSGGFYAVGCIAPHSIVNTDQDIYWLSDIRRVVKFTRGQIVPISTPYDREIAQYSSVSDCRAFRVEIDGVSFLAFTFPAAAKTLVYNPTQDKWHEWSYWNQTTGERERWVGECYQWIPTWGLHLVGDRRTAKLYSFSKAVYSDDGGIIRCQKVTGHIDYGTLKTKRSEQIRLRAKRGTGGIGRDPKVMIRLNDDNKGFGLERQYSLGKEGEREIVLKIPRSGMFRTRQYEIVVSDAVPFAIGAGEEDLTILDR